MSTKKIERIRVRPFVNHLRSAGIVLQSSGLPFEPGSNGTSHHSQTDARALHPSASGEMYILCI